MMAHNTKNMPSRINGLTIVPILSPIKEVDFYILNGEIKNPECGDICSKTSVGIRGLCK